MNKEELDSIQELIERKILLAEVSGGLTSSDKKFINLWNYTIELQDNWNKLKEWLEEGKKVASERDNRIGYNFTTLVLDKMQEIEGGMNE